MSGLILVAASACLKLDWRRAWQVMRRDARKMKSPNAGYPEAAAAGALGVQLGGTNIYFGQAVEKPTLGDAQKPITIKTYGLMIRLMYLSSLLAFLVTIGVRYGVVSSSMTIVHGGNVYEMASRLGCAPEEILDYSASINPFGPPPGLAEVLGHTYHLLQHYPDIQNGVLLESIARYQRVSQDQVVVGNGSTELIYWLPKVLGIRKALIVLPTFGEYQKAFELQDVHLAKLVASPDDGFQPTVEKLDELVGQFAPEAILFTHPGSPSGTLLPHEVREWLVEKGRSRRGFLHR